MTGLRERKKIQTRKAIAATAVALFEARGFEAVTVAEIADAANVSVKTLFSYFASKEDLIFENEHQLRDQILDALRARTKGQTVLDAVAGLLKRLLQEDSEDMLWSGMEGFRRMVRGVPTVEARLRLMWERYELALAEFLATEMGGKSQDPKPMMAAMQIVSLFRALTSSELHDAIRYNPKGQESQALRAWVQGALAFLKEGWE